MLDEKKYLMNLGYELSTMNYEQKHELENTFI